jgi:hypothetical protein
MLVEHEISDQLLEFPVFFFQLAQFPQLGHLQPSKFALLMVEGRLSDTQRATDLQLDMPASAWCSVYTICSSTNSFFGT